MGRRSGSMTVALDARSGDLDRVVQATGGREQRG